MPEYENNNATRFAEDTFAEFEFDYGDVPGKEYIESLNTVTTFYDYTYTYAQKKGFEEDKSNADALAKFIIKLGEERNAPLSSLNTVKNWLKKAPPVANQSGRENVYILCFALGLNAKETKEFFLKAYLERPFNYKNIHEAVYFFCMNNGLPYPKAKEIIEEIEALPEIDNSDAEQVTEQIGYAISLITTEEDLIKYLANNRCGFMMQNKTATEKIKILIKECQELATKELSADSYDDSEKFSVTKIDELLDVIYGYSARGKNGKGKLNFSISDSNFPERIKKNFPQRQQIENILTEKASFDVIRKALILLNFYHFFTNAYLKGENDYSKYWFDEFVDETNTLLAECGYVQLYWRNPYDWMFGHCAYSADVGEYPVDQLRILIEDFYLKYSNPDGKYHDETDFTN